MAVIPISCNFDWKVRYCEKPINLRTSLSTFVIKFEITSVSQYKIFEIYLISNRNLIKEWDQTYS